MFPFRSLPFERGGAVMEMGRDREILEELAELGLAVAKTLKERIAAAGDADCADLTLAFTRVSRSIRQTLACKAKLGEKLATRARQTSIETSRLRFKKRQVARDVGEMVVSFGASENLLTDLRERLDDPDI